jgi:tRNA(fMet)-specific endonuclease VapC
MIVIDTDICIEILRGNKSVIAHRTRSREDVAIAFISVGELYYSACYSKFPRENLRAVETLLLTVRIIDSDLRIMEEFGKLKAHLRHAGRMVPDADILVAATALTNGTKLITGNTRHFKRFVGLKVENWAK